MPLLDVSEVFDDPELTDEIVVKRYTENVTTDGLSVPIVTSFSCVSAVVTGGKGADLRMLADGQRVYGLITVHTPFLLLEGTPTRKADHVVFQGAEYSVLNVANFSNYGVGFVTAQCELFDLQGPEPVVEQAPGA